MPDHLVVPRYKQLVKAMNELAAILHPDLIYEYVITAATKLSDAESGWILVPDHNNKRLNLVAGFLPEENRDTTISAPIHGSKEGWAFLNQQPILTNNPDSEEHGEFINLGGSFISSAIIIPISIKGKRIFILEVINKQNGIFNQDDLEILASLSRHAAICIDKSRRSFQSDLIPELVHELRTPLAALNTALHLLQRTDLPHDKREHISQMIQIEFNRLAELTTSYLDYARLESGKEKYRHSRFDLIQLINDSVEVMQMQHDCKEIKISLNLPLEPIYLSADRDKIKQVILNLLNNAIKYNRAGGEIYITASSSSEYITFSLQDSGQGIPNEHLTHIFERFYRIPTVDRKIKGTGLGLAICKQIVEAHNGKIEVTSIEGQGSTFTVQLPVNGEKLAVPA